MCDVCGSAGVERPHWRRIEFLCPEMPATHTHTHTHHRSDTQSSEMWACRHYTPPHRHTQTCMYTHADGADTQVDRYPDSMQASAVHSH